MAFSDIVRGQPGQYVAASGALFSLEERLALFQQPVIITGQQSYSAVVAYLGKELPYPVLRYDGTASHEDMARLAGEARALGSDVVVGIGGGKVMDTTKGVAELLKLEPVFIPTLVATCACSTPLAVVYHPDHRFKTLDYYQRSGFMTLVDYTFLVTSPASFFLSGVSDTLAKWYELEILHRQTTVSELPAMTQLALATARVSREVLLKDTQKALADHTKGQVTDAFKRIVDTVYAVAATVGCQTSNYVSGAHAIHNGLTLFAETHAIAHGLKVSYGILVQLCATDDDKEVQKLLPFYKQNGFIYQWGQLGIIENKKRAQEAVARFATSSQESFAQVSGMTAERVMEAMERLEELVQAFEQEESSVRK